MPRLTAPAGSARRCAEAAGFEKDQGRSARPRNPLTPHEGVRLWIWFSLTLPFSSMTGNHCVGEVQEIVALQLLQLEPHLFRLVQRRRTRSRINSSHGRQLLWTMRSMAQAVATRSRSRRDDRGRAGPALGWPALTAPAGPVLPVLLGEIFLALPALR